MKKVIQKVTIRRCTCHACRETGDVQWTLTRGHESWNVFGWELAVNIAIEWAVSE